MALVCSTYAAADLLEGLVLYMPLDEGNGNKVDDFSENGFEGELNGGPKWVDGKFGKALQFSASSDFVAIEDDGAFHIEDEITQLHGLISTDCRVHTLSFLAHAWVAVEDTSDSAMG